MATFLTPLHNFLLNYIWNVLSTPVNLTGNSHHLLKIKKLYPLSSYTKIVPNKYRVVKFPIIKMCHVSCIHVQQ